MTYNMKCDMTGVQFKFSIYLDQPFFVRWGGGGTKRPLMSTITLFYYPNDFFHSAFDNLDQFKMKMGDLGEVGRSIGHTFQCTSIYSCNLNVEICPVEAVKEVARRRGGSGRAISISRQQEINELKDILINCYSYNPARSDGRRLTDQSTSWFQGRHQTGSKRLVYQLFGSSFCR